jgi:hypothetical protein
MMNIHHTYTTNDFTNQTAKGEMWRNHKKSAGNMNGERCDSDDLSEAKANEAFAGNTKCHH